MGVRAVRRRTANSSLLFPAELPLLRTYSDHSPKCIPIWIDSRHQSVIAASSSMDGP